MIKSKLIWQEIHHTKCKNWYHETRKIIIENENILIAPFNDDEVYFAIHYCPWEKHYKYALHFVQLDAQGFIVPITGYETSIKANNYISVENAKKRAQKSIGEYFVVLARGRLL